MISICPFPFPVQHLSASGGSRWTWGGRSVSSKSLAPFPVGLGSEARLGAETWGPMGCGDRLQRSTSPAQPGPGASAGRGKLVDTRWRFVVSPPLPGPLQQSWRCWQGRAGEVAPAGCWSLSNWQRWSFLGTIPSAAACLLRHCLHPPQAAQWEVLLAAPHCPGAEGHPRVSLGITEP